MSSHQQPYFQYHLADTVPVTVGPVNNFQYHMVDAFPVTGQVNDFQYHMVEAAPVTFGQINEGINWTHVGGANVGLNANVELNVTPEEKRRRRMIRNRESAARSRARKQAYVAQLLLDMESLKKENKILKNAVKHVLFMASINKSKMANVAVAGGAGLQRAQSKP